MQTNLRFDHQLLAVEGEHDVHCMLELHAPDAPDTDRPPLHLALVVDRSGSMAGAKLAAAQAYRRFAVVGAGPHRFDANHDGVGCEG